MARSQGGESAAHRLPPQDLEAEKAVISGLLLDNSAIHAVLTELRPEDFYHPAHRTLYESIVALADESQPVDLHTLSNHLSNRKQLDAVGGAGRENAGLAGLTDLCACVEPARFTAPLLLARQRELAHGHLKASARLRARRRLAEMLEWRRNPFFTPFAGLGLWATQVALAEDAAGHAVGVELLQRVEVLAGADEFDRHAGDVLHRESRTAAGVAVELRHDDAIELELLVENLRAVDGVLAGHAVYDQVHLLRGDLAVDALELSHELIIDVQPAGRVEDHHIGALLTGGFHRGLADHHGILLRAV